MKTATRYVIPIHRLNDVHIFFYIGDIHQYATQDVNLRTIHESHPYKKREEGTSLKYYHCKSVSN